VEGAYDRECEQFLGMASMIQLMTILAQIDPAKLDSSLPPLVQEASSIKTWLMVGVILVGVILVTFKVSKRNLKED
jgi:hypothetical protein